MTNISRLFIECLEHEDVVYYRWREDDWRVQTEYDEIIPLTEDYDWLEDLYKQIKRGQ